ncbi:MAG: ATP-binding cassette domain-containing protein [Defluviitaleaceae bacterium]|nr:ATP-binding cassette domain-containing protein [Defluviitaleaceae bacterium]
MLQVRDLSIGYNGIAILDDINFCVEGGSYLCIVGENGTGKSTLLKTISRLLKPIYGDISFSVSRKEIGYLSQQTAVQSDFPATVNEIVATGALSKGSWYRPFYRKLEKELIAWAIDKTKITDIKGKCFRELSGGQQRRVLLARALVAAKNFIVLDEPTAGLDPEATKDFYELLWKINRDERVTIIMVTHDIESTMKYATHVLHLQPDDYFFGTNCEYVQFQKGKIT